MLHLNYRDSKAWMNEDLIFSGGSNESCKLFDAALSQYVGWYEDPAMGGLESTLQKLKLSNTDFVMGNVLISGLDLISTGRTTRIDKQFQAEIDYLVDLSAKTTLTPREKNHVTALKYFADGYLEDAANTWEEILFHHPTDMLAIKFAHDTYFYLGDLDQIRDGIARIMPLWNPSTPLYNYLYGMLAFGLEENNFFDKAMEKAKVGLELCPRDGWASHAVSHVLEMTGKQDEGIHFLTSTEGDWTCCEMLACHMYWHLGLYHIEKGDYQSALEVYDENMIKKASSSAVLDIVDVTSLLYRLELEGVNIGDRWHQAMNICKPHISDHITLFNDAHYLMACHGSHNEADTQLLFDSAAEYLKVGKGNNHKLMQTVGMPLLNAMTAFNEGNYSEAFELLYPVRYKVVHIGGSNAQRDVFNQLLIHSAIKSPKSEHKKKAKLLLAERKTIREPSPLTDRLISRLMALHAD